MLLLLLILLTSYVSLIYITLMVKNSSVKVDLATTALSKAMTMSLMGIIVLVFYHEGITQEIVESVIKLFNSPQKA